MSDSDSELMEEKTETPLKKLRYQEEIDKGLKEMPPLIYHNVQATQSTSTSQRVNRKRNSQNMRAQRYRDAHKDEINKRRRENYRKKQNLQVIASTSDFDKIESASCDKDPSTQMSHSKHLHKISSQRYRNTHREEINRRLRESRKFKQNEAEHVQNNKIHLNCSNIYEIDETTPYEIEETTTNEIEETTSGFVNTKQEYIVPEPHYDQDSNPGHSCSPERMEQELAPVIPSKPGWRKKKDTVNSKDPKKKDSNSLYGEFVADSIRNLKNKSIQSWVRNQISNVLYTAEQVYFRSICQYPKVEGMNFSMDTSTLPKLQREDEENRSDSDAKQPEVSPPVNESVSTSPSTSKVTEIYFKEEPLYFDKSPSPY